MPKFAGSFIRHYGIHSLFVRAVSDYFTIALARLIAAHDLHSPEKIASYAPAEATEALRVFMNDLISVVGRRTAGQTLMHEAFGETPIGSFSEFVDATFGVGCFQRWHEALEAEQYESARQAVPWHSSNFRRDDSEDVAS